jgi:hypothetical protein
MNMKNDCSSIWNQYQRQQIESILFPIRAASALERAYYFRFLTFIANEHMLSKLGNKTKESSGFASMWYESLEEKLTAGNIYNNLIMLSPNENTTGNIDRIKLRFAETESNNMSNFRVGDIVILYAYEPGTEPDVRKNMVFRCTIENIQTDNIDLVLRASQSDSRVFLREKGKLWAIEHDFFESSYSSLYRGMHAFLSAPQERRDLLLLQRSPQIDGTLSINGDYGEYDNLVERGKQARDFFLIIGPPGTGKTSYGLVSALKEELTEPRSTILLLSYTNRAVDEICGKLNENNIEYIRIGGGLSCSQESSDHLLNNISRNCKNISELKQVISSARVVVATTTAMNSNISLFNLKQFSLAIIDEASQILEPHLIGILSAKNNGAPAVKRFILIGDHKQLPAVVQQTTAVSKVQDVDLNSILLSDCRLSLFERLLKKYKEYPQVVYMLTKQGRMHRDIALFPNYTFYNNSLEVVPVAHQEVDLPIKGVSTNGIDNLLTTRRVVFLHCDSPKESQSDKINQPEADMIAATVLRIYNLNRDNFDLERTVGVIVPYRNQIATVRNAIDKFGIAELHDITIDTVERYQGSQRKYIIYGFTIQKYYQLNFLTNNVFEDVDGSVIDRKLNVAITRAEEHLILVGNTELLANNFTFYKLIEFVRSRHGLFCIPIREYIEGAFIVPEYDKEDLDLSRATFTTSKLFNQAFDNLVLSRIKEDPSTQWPTLIFGNDMPTNLNAIGYGRINFSNQLILFDELQLSPQKQVLLYCYYIMRQHYCSSKNIYNSYAQMITQSIDATNGRLQFIDVGCGPATCGIAFGEQFLKCAPNMVYVGIDISTEMKKMGERMMDNVLSNKLHYQMLESLNDLDNGYWNGVSELPSTVIFNISYFFSNITSKYAEDLANKIIEIMKSHPLNKYIFIIQHSETDKGLNSFKVFKRILSSLIPGIMDRKVSFSYVLNYKERAMPFYYNYFDL